MERSLPTGRKRSADKMRSNNNNNFNNFNNKKKNYNNKSNNNDDDASPFAIRMNPKYDNNNNSDDDSSPFAAPIDDARRKVPKPTNDRTTTVDQTIIMYDPKEAKDDPFPNALRCPAPVPGQDYIILDWYSPRPAVKLHVEESLIDLLVRYGKGERGMFKDQPEHRLRKLRRACQQQQQPQQNNNNNDVNNNHHQNDNNHHHAKRQQHHHHPNVNKNRICLIQALSLRRHHMKRLNPFLSMSALKLGNDDDIRTSARLFEEAIQHHLQHARIDFHSERDQKRHIEQYKRPEEPYPPTPDFILKQPVRIRQYYYYNNNNNNKSKRTNGQYQSGRNQQQQQQQQQEQRKIIQEYTVCWIEAKMFYGASSVPHDNKSAVGCLLATAEKYVRVYGPGAMVFMYGYGDQLAAQLKQMGVLALDCGFCSCHPRHCACAAARQHCVNLRIVQEHQQRWCANREGEILP